MLAFRSLDPFRALREPDRRRRDEERLSRSEQRTDYKPKSLLDSKSESISLQQRVHGEPDFRCSPFSAARLLGMDRRTGAEVPRFSSIIMRGKSAMPLRMG